MKLSLGFSPCPNDTFIFDALVNHAINTEGLHFDVHLEDVQTLNEWALDGKLDITKLSYGVVPKVLEKYILLNSGGALGIGVGPLLISKAEMMNGGKAVEEMTIAVPGKDTTANLLFSYAYPNAKNKVYKIFHQIEEAILSGEVDAGVIIHENRFTYQQKGLLKIKDLGSYWEETMNTPIPLGGIAIKKNIDPAIQLKVEKLIGKSLKLSNQQYPEISEYVKHHAQSLSETVMRQHIDLYVNDYSLNLGEKGKNAVQRFLQVYAQEHQVKFDEREPVFL